MSGRPRQLSRWGPWGRWGRRGRWARWSQLSPWSKTGWAGPWGRWLAAAVVAAPLVFAAGVGASVARTNALRASFETQFWIEARYPTSELLGARTEVGRLVGHGDGGTQDRAHCDFVAEAVYGAADDYEAIEDHYQARTIVLGGQTPLAFDVRPVSDRALQSGPLPPGDPDRTTRDLLERTNVDLARALTFETIYTVTAVSWGHAAWLDPRCR